MDDARTVWCGNLSDKVTEELLYELFLQAAPLQRVKIPSDKEGRKSNFGFVTFKHECSVDYATQLLNGTRLFDKCINVKPRNNNQNRTPQRSQELPHPQLDMIRPTHLFNDHRQPNDRHFGGGSNQHDEDRWRGDIDNYRDHMDHNSHRDTHMEPNYRDREDRRYNNSFRKHDRHNNSPDHRRQNHSPDPRRHNNYKDRRGNFDRNKRNRYY
ncbi:unnamed protein product [Acanthoscelides obtectus]|uniref:RRM domain-containing protein n=1 Tax=Acanthoscelides obtectus TaxID=200917 RepID=A0A9P0LW91_ACAOB|nr:unnamed protein product [Acanthoscelides obtectus]CAH2001143.1 unnamed protein product [Acanthoscelides obtectus]CAK1665553.1 RNA-binding protein 7 [Acanthoscelides obtectus]CAK1665612.1 RNA-binding protein 7 [Acanthoscelides obtectus]